MAVREVRDEIGRVWIVWEVHPQFVDRRRPGAPTRSPTGHERRQRDEPRVRLAPELIHGWLAAETVGERRRIAPIPPAWAVMSESELLRLLAAALARPSRRRLAE